MLFSVTLIAGEIDAPSGFVAYCKTNPQPKECKLTYKAPSHAPTPKVNKFNDLEEINALVNGKMVYQRDLITYGKDELWVDPQPRWIGDCEDSVLKKMHLLHEKGWATDSLRIATVRFYDNEPPAVLSALGRNMAANHAVLIATYDGVQYVLDAVTDRVVSVNDFREVFGVKIVSIQSLDGKWITYDR